MLKESQEKNFTYEEQKNEPERSGAVNVVESMAEVLKNIAQFEPNSKDERLQKMYLQEQVSDVITTLQEGGDRDILNLIVAFRGLEQAKNQYRFEQDNFGIDSAMNELQKNVQDIEGFNLGKVEDLDRVFEDARGDVKEAMRLKIEDLSEEQAAAEKSKFERYFSIKQEIQARQRQIFGESKSFYRGISEKISGSLLKFITAKGEKIDDSMKDSRVALLKYIGDYGMGNKFARALGLGIIVVGALGYTFKGELAQAAQFENDIQEKNNTKITNGRISSEELRLKDPEMYNLLESNGFIKMAGVELVEEGEPERPEKNELQPLTRLFEKATRETDAVKLLETDEYRNADTPRELRTLYQKFNEKDDDPSDDLAVREKYEQFLRSYSKEEMIAKYGKQEMEKIYQEAGYVNFKSLEKYFEKDMEDKVVDTESLKGYLHGFKNASDFYKNSLDLSREHVKEGKLNKAFVGLIEVDSVLSNIANTAMIYGDVDDKGIAASIRNLIYQNITEFNRLKGKVNIVNLGREKFLFLNPDILKNVINKDVGGMGIATMWAAESVNKGVAAGRFSRQEKDFIGILTNEKILIKTEKGFIGNPEKPFLLFALPETYAHENQHYEFVKNDNLMKYWINEWNSMDRKSRDGFMLSLYNTRVYLRGINEKEIKVLLEDNLSFEEIKGINSKDLQGIEASRLERFKMSVLQEFQAYSTDNLLRTRVDLKHEIPLQP